MTAADNTDQTALVTQQPQNDQLSELIPVNNTDGVPLREFVQNLAQEQIKKPNRPRTVVFSAIYNTPFIVFTDLENHLVDAEASSVIFEDIMQGIKRPPYYRYPDGRKEKIYRSGFKQKKFLPRNPLFPDKPLCSNEDCHYTGFNWNHIADTVKYILIIGVQQNIIKISRKKREQTVEELHGIAGEHNAIQLLFNKFLDLKEKVIEVKQSKQVPALNIRHQAKPPAAILLPPPEQSESDNIVTVDQGEPSLTQAETDLLNRLIDGEENPE